MSYFSNLAHMDPGMQTGGVGARQAKGGDEKRNADAVVGCMRSNSGQIIGHKLDRNIGVDTWARSLLNSAWAELFYTANLSSLRHSLGRMRQAQVCFFFPRMHSVNVKR